jgi:hypothetical protein
MALTFNGLTLTGGVTPLFGSNDLLSRGRIAGRRCFIDQESGIGISFDPFSFEIPCDCQPQPGDTIEVISRSILLVDVTTIRWSLCGGECEDEKTEVGLCIGLEGKRLRWRVA